MQVDKTYLIHLADQLFDQAIEHRINAVGLTDKHKVAENLHYFRASANSYMLSKSAVLICDKVKVDKTSLRAFSQLKTGLCHTVGIIGHPGFLFRYGLFDDVLTVLILSRAPNAHNLSYFIHRIYVKQGIIATSDGYKIPDEEWESLQACLKIIVFLEMSETETVLIRPNHAIGTRKNGVLNQTKSSFIHVDSKWNVESIRIDGFWVSGHFRLQYYKSLDKHKLVYINPYQKNGYIRKAKSGN